MTEKQIDVALKWLAGEMSNAQAAKALRIRSQRNVYTKMATLFRELYRMGRIRRINPVPIRGTVE